MKKYFFVQKLLQPILSKNLLPTKAHSIEQQLNTFKKNSVMKNICLKNVYSIFQMNEIFQYFMYTFQLEW